MEFNTFRSLQGRNQRAGLSMKHSAARLLVPIAIVAAIVAVLGVAGPTRAEKRSIRPRPGAAAPPSKESSEPDEAELEQGDEPAEPVDSDIVRLHLMDGSMITGKLSISEIQIETPYGKLTTPVRELRSFTPGLINHPDLGKQIHDLIEALGADQFETREKAQKMLLKIGKPLRGELEKRSHDPDHERRTRIRAILDEFDEDSEDDSDDPAPVAQAILERDQVETAEFTIVGRILTPTLSITSNYGPLTVKISDVRRGERDAPRRADVRRTIGVDGSCIISKLMKDTRIHLERGDRVTITAEGSIVMAPWGAGATCSPDGAGNYGWYLQGQIPSGALVGVIGRSDNVFKLGSKASFKAERSGTLRLAIAMQADYADQNFPGRYNVKIHVEPRR
jgi:hypothetical protein